MRIFIAAALVLTLAGAANAEEHKSANYWLPYCKAMLTPRPTASSWVCLGMVIAIEDQFLINRDLTRQEGGVCDGDIPESVTNEQILRVVIRYIEARPKDMHAPFVTFVELALVDAWPCKVGEAK
jgi:Rap1a immunity proteins